MHPMLNIAVKAARKAGSVITRASEDIEGLTINKKSYNDFVSEVDITSEKIIIDTLKDCLLYTSPSPRDGLLSRMPSSA